MVGSGAGPEWVRLLGGAHSQLQPILQMCSPIYSPCQSSIPLTLFMENSSYTRSLGGAGAADEEGTCSLPSQSLPSSPSPWNQLGDSAAMLRAQAYYAILTYATILICPTTLYYPNLGDFGVWPWRPWCPNSIVSIGPWISGRSRNSWGPLERQKKK